MKPNSRRMPISAAVALSILSIFVQPDVGAWAADARPRIQLDCALVKSYDDYWGPVTLFDPRAKVKWWGKKLMWVVYYQNERDELLSQQARRSGTVTRKGYTNGSFWEDLDLSNTFNSDSKSGFRKVFAKITDDKKRSATMTCVWEGPSTRGR